MHTQARSVGRPAVITPGAVNALVFKLRRGYGVSVACTWAGIGRTTYYRNYAANPDFAATMDKAKTHLARAAKSIIFDAIVLDHNTDIAKWYLSRRDPDFR